MEGLLKKHILQHLVLQNILAEEQFGFLSKRTTLTQLISCLNDWTGQIDKGVSIDVIYFYFAKAFDTVSHVKLLHKLNCNKINLFVIKWIQSFLTNRTQHVRYDEVFSVERKVISGIA